MITPDERRLLLSYAIDCNIENVRRFLRSKAGDYSHIQCRGGTALTLASAYGFADVVYVLLNHGKLDANVKCAGGETSIMMASVYNHVIVVRELLKHDEVDVDAETKLGETALMLASKAGHVDVVVELLKLDKVDVNNKTKVGKTSLILASEEGIQALFVSY
jgi:ankyrin repeat protein